MGILSALPYVAAGLGQLAHMVKKKEEVKKAASSEEVDQIGLVKTMISKKPVNTLMSVVLGMGAVSQVPIMDLATLSLSELVPAVVSFFMTGWAADSAANRPGS